MLEEKITKLGKKWESFPEEKQEQIGKRILLGFNTTVGAGAGTIDVLFMGGAPIFSVGLPAYDIICKLPALILHDYNKNPLAPEPWLFVGHDSEDKKKFFKEVGKNKVAYALGASIPFLVQYHDRIIDFVYQVTDKLF